MPGRVRGCGERAPGGWFAGWWAGSTGGHRGCPPMPHLHTHSRARVSHTGAARDEAEGGAGAVPRGEPQDPGAVCRPEAQAGGCAHGAGGAGGAGRAAGWGRGLVLAAGSRLWKPPWVCSGQRRGSPVVDEGVGVLHAARAAPARCPPDTLLPRQPPTGPCPSLLPQPAAPAPPPHPTAHRSGRPSPTLATTR